MTHSRVVRLTFLLLFFGLSAIAWSQDTRGSLVPDAPVVLSDGTVTTAENLRVGASIRVWIADGTAGSALITAVRRQHIDSFILLKAGALEFRANGSHRVALAGGKLVRLDSIKEGDQIWLDGPQAPRAATVASLRLYPANMVAYDLTVAGHLPFVVGGLVVGD